MVSLGGRKPWVLDVHSEEWPAVIWSFFYFFFLLSAYYVLRPVRDEMGIQSGVKNLPQLFTYTFLGMLTLVPIFGLAASRWPRPVLVPAVYLFFVLHLVGFFVAMRAFPSSATVAKCFFVWLSVFNYFVVSVFWSFMADIFATEQAKRVFSLISAGGAIGALAGPTITALLVHRIGIANLLLVSALLLGMSVVCILRLSSWAQERAKGKARTEAAVGGGILSGIRLALANPYLLGIAGYILLLQTLGTFFYLEQTRVVSETLSSPAQRTQLFARLDLYVNGLTLLLQIFVTGQLVLRMGIASCLMLLPILGGAGLVAVGVWPIISVVVAAAVIRRAVEFAVSKPAREVLYTVATREERYKAKNVIDTLVSRGGDALSGWGHSALKGLGMSPSSMAFATLPFAIGMVGIAAYLGRKQEALRHAQEQEQKAAASTAPAA